MGVGIPCYSLFPGGWSDDSSQLEICLSHYYQVNRVGFHAFFFLNTADKDGEQQCGGASIRSTRRGLAPSRDDVRTPRSRLDSSIDV
jgi:hypothetical protein